MRKSIPYLTGNFLHSVPGTLVCAMSALVLSNIPTFHEGFTRASPSTGCGSEDSMKGHTVGYTATTVSINEEHLRLTDLGCSEPVAMYMLPDNSVPGVYSGNH